MDQLKDFEACNCRLLFVSYSDPTRPLHRIWIEEWCKNNINGTSAVMVLDPTKSVYQAWSIPSSTMAAWGPANVWYYIKAILCRGRRSIAIQGEAGQLGADFVLAPGGKVLERHYCRNPTDRIAVSKLLQVVRSYASKKQE